MQIHPARLAAAGCAALALLLAAAPARAQDESPYHAARCPVPAGVEGYPVTVRTADGARLDSAFAAALVDAVTRRWEPPSPRRREYDVPGRVQRIDPPEPLWPDDWSPRAGHRARVAMTLYLDGRQAPALSILEGSGDRDFDASLGTITENPRLGRHPLPGVLADSVRVLIGFGHPPEPGDAVVRFAVQQTPVRVVPGTLVAIPPPDMRSPSATVTYDVDERGRVKASSIRVLRVSDERFSHILRMALWRARFEPAQANCRPIARTVVQQFGN
jgi:hypothetical protein